MLDAAATVVSCSEPLNLLGLDDQMLVTVQMLKHQAQTELMHQVTPAVYLH